jgi:hypothetical protein
MTNFKVSIEEAFDLRRALFKLQFSLHTDCIEIQLCKAEILSGENGVN